MLALKFFLVGIVNTIFGYSVYALGIFFGLHYQLSLLIATILGVIFNFRTIRVLVFKSQKKNIFIRFMGVYGFNYFINLIGIWLLMKLTSNSYLAALVVLPITTVISYLLNKRIVFDHE